jgi:outer membrane immunogenic protein
VIGIEGDFQGSSASKSWSWVGSNINGDANVYTAKIQTNWLASINGRLGVAYDRALFYAIGGAAWAQGSTSLSGAAPSGLFIGSISRNTDLSGFDVGAGVEYAFTPNWVGRVEYRYYDFGSYNIVPNWAAGYDPIRPSTSINTVRVGLAYLFSAPAPVVAKY